MERGSRAPAVWAASTRSGRCAEVPNDAGATLLASLRADCHLQVHELSTPHKPIAVLGAALPAVGHRRP